MDADTDVADVKGVSMITFSSCSILYCPDINAGFHRGYNAQHCLITLIDKWKKSADNGGTFGAFLLSY